jgi:glyoxylase-like metal-dependent hydrolase (beta-lactamase superfamily II)
MIGGMQAFAMYTPGHTPACMVHVMGNAAFVGDTLFMPDGGSARADFPGGDAGTLYDSIQKVLSLPDDMRLFMCHDYGPNGRDIQWETTVGDEKAHNIHVGGGKTRRSSSSSAPSAMPSWHAASDHPVAAGQHARRRHADRQGWPPMLKVPVNGL